LQINIKKLVFFKIDCDIYKAAGVCRRTVTFVTDGGWAVFATFAVIILQLFVPFCIRL